MPFAVVAETAPISRDADGVVRISGTRVTLDTVVAAFADWMSAEGIVEQYPTLRLGEVYSVIGYYLNHRAEIEEYLHERRQQSDAVRRENETRFEPNGVRESLLARRQG